MSATPTEQGIHYVVQIDGTPYSYQILAGAIPGYVIRVGDPVIMLTCPR